MISKLAIIRWRNAGGPDDKEISIEFFHEKNHQPIYYISTVQQYRNLLSEIGYTLQIEDQTVLTQWSPGIATNEMPVHSEVWSIFK